MKNDPHAARRARGTTPDGVDDTDRAVIELIRSRLQTGDRSESERAAFSARIFDRIETPNRRRWAAPAFALAATVLVLLATVWPRVRETPAPETPIATSSTAAAPSRVAATASPGGSFLSVAYYGAVGETELDSGDDESDYLPDRYRTWSDALDVDSDFENGAS